MAYRNARKHTKRVHSPPPTKPSSKLGTPSGVYLPSEENLVRMLACKGATDSEIEQICLLPPGTLGKWRKLYPSLDAALAEGRSKPDGDVLYAMYRTAVGYEFEEEQAVGGRDPTVLTVKKKALGQFPAQRYWLENRRKEEWKTRSHNEHTGKDGGAIGVKVEDRNSIIDSILALVTPKPDPEPKKQGART